MLKGLSRERIGMELLNLLGLPDPAPTVARMGTLGVLAVILPEGNPDTLTRLVTEERRQGATPDPIRRLAALLPADPALAEQVAARLRLSTGQKKRLASAVEPERASDCRALAYRIGIDQARDRLLLQGVDIAPLDGWNPPALPLKGGEIVARGIKAGPDVARVMRQVEERWIAEGFPPAARVAELLDEAVAR